MKTKLWTILFVIIQPVLAHAQILRYQFNEGIGTNTASSGSVPDPLTMRSTTGVATTALWGAPGSGTSGSATDRALDLTGATGMGTGFSGPNASLSALSPIAAPNQFTITGWFRPDSTDLNRAVLLEFRNGIYVMSVSGVSGGPVGARNRLRLIVDNGVALPEIDAFGDFEPEWSTANAWAFFAISCDGLSATSTIRLYSGSLAGASALSASVTGTSILFPLGGASLSMGARANHADPFKGYLDDFRLYGSALTASEIEQVRLSAVPEPGATVLLVLGALILLRRREN